MPHTNDAEGFIYPYTRQFHQCQARRTKLEAEKIETRQNDLESANTAGKQNDLDFLLYGGSRLIYKQDRALSCVRKPKPCVLFFFPPDLPRISSAVSLASIYNMSYHHYNYSGQRGYRDGGKNSTAANRLQCLSRSVDRQGVPAASNAGKEQITHSRHHDL